MKNYINIGDFIVTFEKFKGRRMLVLLDKLCYTFQTTKRVEAVWTADQFTEAVHWGSIPFIGNRINRLITGNKDRSFGDHIVEEYFRAKAPSANALTLGCGIGYREIHMAKSGCFKRIDAYDLSEDALTEARIRAARDEVSDVINFERKDLSDYALPTAHYDFVLVEQSLHHFSPLGPLLDKIKLTLKPDGYFIINEFVGPDKFQWTDRQIQVINALLTLIPAKYRVRSHDKKLKKRIYRPGLLRMKLYDPSEAVESSGIVPGVKRRFKIVEERNYGGTILQLLFQDIAKNFMNDDPETLELLELICGVEDLLLRTGDLRSDFTYIVCRP
jgi:2-polyprenyl-3-methyl-5-hydroxy-6-metoxy-1,4-benzoquinol methylase